MESSRTEQLAQIIGEVIPQQGLRHTERIDGFKIPLGVMSEVELNNVYGQSLERVQIAAMELQLIGIYRTERFPIQTKR